MSRTTVYIDHWGGKNDEQTGFAKRIKTMLASIKANIVINTFGDIEVEDDGEEWEKATLKAINAADIIIPIISSNYMAYVTKSIEDEFDRIVDSEDKYLFPILYSPAVWSKNSWLVKSKFLQNSNNTIVESTALSVDNILNELRNVVSQIVGESDRITPVSDSEIQRKGSIGSTVFISHDHDDADFAELLKLKLDKEGIVSWIDSERLKVGQDWREEIDEGISQALAVIVIMTPEARKSEYVTYEWAYAWGKNKPIFPIMLKQTQLHPRLESLQYLDYTNRENRSYSKLIDSIKSLNR